MLVIFILSLIGYILTQNEYALYATFVSGMLLLLEQLLRRLPKIDAGSPNGIPPCPPHLWGYTLDSRMYCKKCKSLPSQETRQ
jgi:hypothetical protein